MVLQDPRVQAQEVGWVRLMDHPAHTGTRRMGCRVVPDLGARPDLVDIRLGVDSGRRRDQGPGWKRG